MKKIVLICMFFMTACATTEQAMGRLSAYNGQHVDDFFRKYGMPERKYEFENKDKVYRWTSGTIRYAMPSTTTYNGTAYDYGTGIASVNGTATTTGGGVFDVECVLDLYTDTNNKIVKISAVRDTLGNWVTSRCAEVFK